MPIPGTRAKPQTKIDSLTARQSLASHQAAQPYQRSQLSFEASKQLENDRSVAFIRLE
jgi:hypothetical protein